QVGHLQHRAGQHKAAEATWKKLLNELETHSRLQSNSRALSSLSSMLSVVYYNLACAQSVQIKLSRSLENLKKAHKHGYKDFAWIKIDGDLEVLRDSPAFVEWFDEHAPPSLAGTIDD
ncbi:MAG: TPR end-of-group domain-containing protein, partial [Planctomycetota bacterium]